VPLFIVLILLTPARADAKTKIEVPLFEGGSGKAFYLLAAREFEKARPDVEVEMYLDPRIAEKMRVRFLEGTFPEITNPGTINYWPLIRNGDVQAIDKWLDGPSWDDPNVTWRDTFLPGSLDYYNENGKHYGIPLSQYGTVIWTNKKMFREHGWKTPVTWDELFALCEQIKQAPGGVAPMAFQGRYSYYAIPFYDHVTYHLGGKEKFDARMMLAPGSITDPDSIEGIRLTRKLAQNYFQSGAFGMSHTESQLQFFLGKTAMIPCGAWLKSEMLGKIPDDFELGCFNLPIPNSGSKVDPSALFVAVEPFFVFTRSKHPEIAMDFMRFVTSRKMAARFAQMQDVPTAIKGANTNLSKDLNDLVAIVDKAKISYGRVPDVEMQQVYADMMYDAMANTALSPQQVAEKYEQVMQGVRQQRVDPTHYDVNHRWKPALFLGLLGVGAISFIWRTARDIRRPRSRITARTIVAQAGLQRLGWCNVLLFVAPAVIVYTIFVIVPSLRSFSWSLHEWNGLTNMSSMPYRGLLNFKRLLLESDGFWIALQNNLFLMFMVPLFVIPLAMFLAASISRGVWGATLFRIVFFFPNLLGGVAATLLWLHLYNPQGGLVNTFLTTLGFHSFDGYAWLEPKNLYWALIPISIWGACGFNMVLYLAAMQSIPESYYEAATIDGATRWRQFWTITLPLIWDVLTISIVFLVIGGMKAFEIIWLLTNQRPQTDNHVIATKMVDTMFNQYRVGEATALAVLLFLMVFVGTAATLRGMRRETVEM